MDALSETGGKNIIVKNEKVFKMKCSFENEHEQMKSWHIVGIVVPNFIEGLNFSTA